MAAEGGLQTGFQYHFLMVILQLQVLDWYKILYILDIVCEVNFLRIVYQVTYTTQYYCTHNGGVVGYRVLRAFDTPSATRRV